MLSSAPAVAIAVTQLLAVAFYVLLVAMHICLQAFHLLLVLVKLGPVGLDLRLAGAASAISLQTLFVLLHARLKLVELPAVLTKVLLVLANVVFQAAGGGGLGKGGRAKGQSCCQNQAHRTHRWDVSL